jgi:hypothetical protein
MFPVYQHNDGVVLREVPIAMVALVATAVSVIYNITSYHYLTLSNVSLQLYAAIQEWCFGTQKSGEFSANSYLDVYTGHVNTFNHIEKHRKDAFHLTMAYIYSHAR